jgi:hypothetical protein
MNCIVEASTYPNFAAILNEILAQWPQHERYTLTH